MGIGDEAFALASDDNADLGVCLELRETINDMRASPFKPSRLADIGRFIEPGLQLDKGGDGLSLLGGLAQGVNDGRISRGPVKRLLDRHHVGIGRGLLQESDDHVEGFIRMMEQHVLLPDRGKHVPAMVLDAFRNPGA